MVYNYAWFVFMILGSVTSHESLLPHFQENQLSLNALRRAQSLSTCMHDHNDCSGPYVACTLLWYSNLGAKKKKKRLKLQNRIRYNLYAVVQGQSIRSL